jgi:hypothetical protein
MTTAMVLVLAAFCALFAINSSIHSYLVVRYAEGDKVAMNVGFYYMANAAGRLTGGRRLHLRCRRLPALGASSPPGCRLVRPGRCSWARQRQARQQHSTARCSNCTAAEAPGRPLPAGTLASGMMYSFVGATRVQGFAACFWASTAFAVASAAAEVLLRDDQGGLMWGGLTLVPASAAAAKSVGAAEAASGSSKDVQRE